MLGLFRLTGAAAMAANPGCGAYPIAVASANEYVSFKVKDVALERQEWDEVGRQIASGASDKLHRFSTHYRKLRFFAVNVS